MPVLSPAPSLFAAPIAKPAAPRAVWKPKTAVSPTDEWVARQAGVSPVAAALLRNRGYHDAASIDAFFHPQPEVLRDPALLPDIDAAVARLVRALEKGEKILIFGDYDADGVTSTALLVRCLRLLRADVAWRLPERHEGYGLNESVIREAKSAGFDLVMSADCGIRDIEPARVAREIGIDLIVTDHHEPSDEIPDCIAVVNPKRVDSRYGFGGLSGCGVAFKVMQALLQAYKPEVLASFSEKYLDLVALSTIADCVPLCDENRYLAAAGLQALYSTRKKGLRALIESAQSKDKEAAKKYDKGFFVGRDVSWQLAPRLNAAGRLASPTLALELLLCDDEALCYDLAQQLNSINSQRKGDQEIALKHAMEQVERETDLGRDVLIVAAHENWPRGIVGLIAGKLVERYHRPAFAFNIHDGHAHGSGRTVGDFDLHALLEATKPHYTRGGGHAAACGLSLPAAQIPDFRAAALAWADGHLQVDNLKPILRPDCQVSGAHLTPQLTRELLLLEPCGTGNEEPQFLLRGARIEATKTFSNGAHLEITLRDEGKKLRAIWWRNGDKLADFRVGDEIELIFVPKADTFGGKNDVQLIIEDARLV
jgi:single-stranded-DNA-specific exonuclease